MGGPWTETILHNFSNMGGDACRPFAAPLAGANGVLYGVTSNGGTSAIGAAYELQPSGSPSGPWTEAVINSFDTLATEGPPTSMIIGPGGSLYITVGVGSTDQGALVRLLPPAGGGGWAATVLYTFTGAPSGSQPNSLTMGAKGVVYGTTELGGMSRGRGFGTVFQYIPPATPGGAWIGRVLYSFQGGADGDAPYFVIQGPGGVLYGLAHSLNQQPATVFQLTPPAIPGGSWTKTVIQSIGVDYKCTLNSSLIVRNGNIYGTSCLTSGGVVFELQAPSVAGGSWTYIPLYTFTNGQVPGGAFVMTSKGVIIGSTINPAGQPPGGTAYALKPQ